MKNRNLTILLVLVLAAAVGVLPTACDQTGKKVTIRFKFQPGMSISYQQITRGLIQIRDLTSDTLTHDEYAETTMDINYKVRRILEDSTAEIIDSKVARSVSRDRLDTTASDSVKDKKEVGQDIIKYIKPNGKLIDMEFASDTARGKLEYLKEYYKQGFPVFPDGPIGQGHSWSQTTTVVLPGGPMEASTTYTIKSFARERGYDCVVVEYDGVSIIPLPEHEVKDKAYSLVGGVDNMTSVGHMYFAYKEGMVVQLKERWILDSDRTMVRHEADTVMGYQPGDTVKINVGIEYDVDYYLTKLEMP